MNGFNGKVLRVNLTDRSIKIEERDERFYRRYMGGEGFVAYTLLTELEPGVDPLSPANRLIFATGVFTGGPLGGSGRHSVGAKSPLTDGFGESEAGGFWGAEFKASGYDAMIVEGRAEEPVYLWIRDGEVEIRPAAHLMGKTTAEVDQVLKEELEERRLRVAQIGPAGERLVRYASVMFDINRAAGRTGMGAVMGSKNLKAVAVRGKGRVQPADKDAVKENARWLSTNVDKLVGGLKEHGTARSTYYQHITNTLPTFNFNAGQFDGAEKIDGVTMTETILVDRDTCYACPVFCKRVVEVEGDDKKGSPRVDRIYGGPEFETLGALGSMCAIDDLEAVAKANELCNAYGLDTISTGATIAFAMECFENGLLTEDITGGFKLQYGDAAAMLEAVHMIVRREGFGRQLGEGSYRLAASLGEGAMDYVMTVKKQELPQQEPRAMHGLGLGYAVSPTGADHMHNIYDQGYTDPDSPKMKKVAALGILDPLDPYKLDGGKVRLFIYETNWLHMVNSIGMCMFMPYDYDQVRDIINGITGWNVTIWELLRAGERVVTMARLFNAREGIKTDSDTLPKRFSKELKAKNTDLNHAGISAEELGDGVRLYYEMMGWDAKTGVPTRVKLLELDIGWAVPLLEMENGSL